ncbi:hypothetical protein SCLCIDRAFT_13670 [Scleroderma citrinum Foug A]|uniref:Uncharacterized protein n=1 Tax=Scleroderma citrinum Foug A TaxID=1036808 RepID=A0A0C3EJJ5_9AGAM|nr:hypothetical protein SCLCIDRAFT_13670 [Scleroderma citrinum Foug A]
MPDSSTAILPGTSRSNSLASTASTSGTSLSRRSRIRKRTRPTGAAQPEVEFENDNVLDISASYSEEPVSALDTSSEKPNLHAATGNDVPPNGDSASADMPSPTGKDSVVIRRGAQSHPERKAETITTAIATVGKPRHSTLPRLTSPPSSFRPTPMEGDAMRSSVRDSLLTQQSSTSSSVYPLSTSTDTESPPSPVSPVEQDHHVAISTVHLDGPNAQEFDADDVAYRLRLLMKNSYFLPPAHSKPLPTDFPPVVSPTKKMPAPFLDLFRMGKTKSKPSSPEAVAPVVRVTSDSTTASGHVSRDHGRSTASPFRPSPVSQHMASMARVVVVREKVDDLDAATKQAEVDLKTHELMEHASRRVKLETFGGIVDPTDEVDVPLPSPNYPFTLQASALHGLGIEDSVGAAVLAERLPPPGSPGLSTLDPRENAWRKALLHEAVGHSLNNSAASLSPGQSTPSRSPRCPRSTESMNARAIQHQRKMLDQKIINHPIIDPSDDTDLPSTPTPAPPANPTGPPATLTPALMPDIHRLSNYAPLRAETPVPHTPLSPPPRRPLGNPQYSRSQTDLTSAKRTPGKQPPSALRKSISSPMLSDAYDLRMWTPTKTPPPVPSLSLSPEPSSAHRMSRMTIMSRYTSSDQGETAHHQQSSRPSLALSVLSVDGGLSPSNYSQPSPTASAFRDRWSEGYHSAHSQLVLEEPSQPLQDTSMSPVSHMARVSAMSPPPRSSSSAAGIALFPAPRPGYLPLQSTPSRAVQLCRSSSELSRGTFRSFASASAAPPTQLASTLNVNPSVISFHSALHSAPPPSSTAEFFDHIQGHPAMDGHYDSEDSASEVDQEITAGYASPQQPQPCPPTPLGNISTPDICGATVPYYPTGITKDRKKPVGNVPTKSPYFTNIKTSPHSLTQLSLAQHSREHLVDDEDEDESSSTAPATGGDHVRRWQRDQLALEASSKKLDGMVMQHMQAERDRMKRIAQTSKVPQSSSSFLP